MINKINIIHYITIHSKRFFIFVLLGGLFQISACGNKKTQPDPPRGETQSVDNSDSTPSDLTAEDLREAAFNNQMAKVQEAIKQGIDVNDRDDQNRTALMLASFNGHNEIVKLLLNQDAKLDMRNSEGRTALMFAASGPFPETVTSLLEAGADPNLVDTKEHWTALMFAAAEGNTKVVQTLLKHGADASKKDVDGDTALNFARDNGHNDVVQILQDI